MAAVTNFHKLNHLTQIYSLLVLISEVQNQCHWAKVKVLAGWFFLKPPKRESLSLPFLASGCYPSYSLTVASFLYLQS